MNLNSVNSSETKISHNIDPTDGSDHLLNCFVVLLRWSTLLTRLILFIDFGVIYIFLLMEILTLSLELLVMRLMVWLDDERFTLLVGRFLFLGFLGGDRLPLGFSRDSSD